MNRTEDQILWILTLDYPIRFRRADTRPGSGFMARLRGAVAYIEAPKHAHYIHGRELDAAFESGDGDQMMAALWTLAVIRPTLARRLKEDGYAGEIPAHVARLIASEPADVAGSLSALYDSAAIARGIVRRGPGMPAQEAQAEQGMLFA